MKACIRVYNRVLQLPRRMLFAGVILLCLLGAFAVRNSFFDVWVAILSGGLGYGFTKLGIPVLPLAFGAVLGPILEENLRRTLMIYKDWTIFFERPISLVLITIALLVLLGPLLVRAFQFVRVRR